MTIGNLFMRWDDDDDDDDENADAECKDAAERRVGREISRSDRDRFGASARLPKDANERETHVGSYLQGR